MESGIIIIFFMDMSLYW